MPYQPYNLTPIANSSGIVSLLQTVNTELMKGYFGILILASIWIISFMAFTVTTNNNGIKSAAASSFISFVLCIFLRGLGLVPDLAIFITLVLTALTVVLAKD